MMLLELTRLFQVIPASRVAFSQSSIVIRRGVKWVKASGRDIG
jgi:hypothetical protein